MSKAIEKQKKTPQSFTRHVVETPVTCYYLSMESGPKSLLAFFTLHPALTAEDICSEGWLPTTTIDFDQLQCKKLEAERKAELAADGKDKDEEEADAKAEAKPKTESEEKALFETEAEEKTRLEAEIQVKQQKWPDLKQRLKQRLRLRLKKRSD